MRGESPATGRSTRDLSGTVCLVTGASRGAGRGIAVELGSRGATVYVSARDTARAPIAAEHSLAGTAALVREAGGTGIAVRCDHTVDADVAALVERVRSDHGSLDVLVNNAWGGYEQRGDAVPFFDAPFWELPLWHWDGMFTAGVRASFLTSKHAAPLMLGRSADEPRLIANTIAWAFGAYLGNLLYDAAKAATARMAFGMAQELRAHHIAAVALALGHLGVSESPRYGGRAVAALASDPAVLERTGQIVTAGGLARDYGFTDLDGTQPRPSAFRKKSDE